MRHVVALVVGALASACTLVLSPSDLMGDDVTPIEPRAFCDQLAASYCVAHESCCSPEQTIDQGSCLSTTRALCNWMVDIASDARAGYDGVAALAVLAESERLLEACDPDVLPYLLSSDGLLATLAGTVPPGDECSTRDVPNVAEFFSCQEERACVRVGANRWTCLQRVPLGGSCRNDSDCAEGLYCDSALPSILEGTCVERLANDSPCSRGNQCLSYVCAGDETKSCQTLTAENVYCALGQ
jgi:hypothetical protein